MPETPNDIENVSPYKLLDGFSKSRVLPCILFALILHVAVIGGLSTEFIYYKINPDAKPKEGTAAKQDDAANPADDAKSDDDKSGDAGKGDDKKDGDKSGGDGKTPPVVDRVTDKADPDKIPDAPGLGIPLDDDS